MDFSEMSFRELGLQVGGETASAFGELAARIGPEALVHAAALTMVAGYLMRDQLRLRALLLVGNGFYAAYYYAVADRPLWDALFWAGLMVATNAMMMLAIFRGRHPGRLCTDGARLFSTCGALEPGEVRRLMRLAEVRTASEPTVLTRIGHSPEKLYFVIDGEVEIARWDRVHRCSRPQFIGELAFLLGAAASATVTLSKGARYIAWDPQALRMTMDRRDDLARGLERAFSRDIAEKLREQPEPGLALTSAGARLGVVA